MSRLFKRPAATAAVALVLLLAAYLFSSRLSSLDESVVTSPDSELTNQRRTQKRPQSPGELKDLTRVAPVSVKPEDSKANNSAVTVKSPSPIEEPLSETIPDLQIIRDQVSKDPHTTPPAILAFSVELTQRMNQLSADEAGAERAFAELEDCVLNDRQKNSNTVQALCILHAHKLSTKYPALNARFEQLATHADAESLRRAKALF